MSMRKGTIVRFPDGRVAVKKVAGYWEVSGTTIERYRDSELDEGYTVVYTPVRNVSEYRLGTAVLVGKDVYVKVGSSTFGDEVFGYWETVDGESLSDRELAETEFIELFVDSEGE